MNEHTPAAGPSTSAADSAPAGGASPSVAKRTSSRHALRETASFYASPPSTPPNPRRRNKREGKQQTLRAHASDLEARILTTEPGSSNRFAKRSASGGDPEAPRHSHGLSWSSTTRDSVVDNLLLSLDNLSSNHIPEVEKGVPSHTPVDIERFALPSRINQRSRGHTYSSSLSSDFALQDSPASTLSAKTAKGRRSNSASNFSVLPPTGRSALAPILNGIGRAFPDPKQPDKSTLSVASGQPPQRPNSSRAFGDEFNAVLESSRLAFGGGRSLSMDQLYAESQASRSSILDRGRPVPSVYSKYESNLDVNACPEPMVAGGPRKRDNPTATGPVYVNQAPSKQSTLRKITTQSDLKGVGSPQLSPPIPFGIRNQASEFVRANSMRGSIAPDDASIAGVTSQQGRRQQSPARERPGFFKRVFGSSRSSMLSPEQAPPLPRNNSDRPDTSAVSRTRSQGSLHGRPRSEMEQHAPPSEARPGTQSASHPPPALNKKPSSFFRRRKKSHSEAAPVPALPANIGHPSANVQPPEPSPSASSLRKVMDPYISADSTAPNGKENRRPDTSESSTSEDLDIFHSGYTPRADPALRRITSLTRESSLKVDNTFNESPRLKVKKRRPEPLSVDSTATLQPDAANPKPVPSPALDASNDRSGGVSPISATQDSDRDLRRVPSRASTGDMIIASGGAITSESPEASRNFSDGTYVSVYMPGEGWVMTTGSPEQTRNRPESKKSERLYLQPTPTGSEERLDKLKPQAEGSRKNSKTHTSAGTTPAETPSTRFHSAVSLPLVQIEGNELPRSSMETATAHDASVIVDDGAEYRERARKIFEGDEEDVAKADAAAWLGERNVLSTRTLKAYMHIYDFSGKNVLSALRMLCGRLVLRGESQQFDRIVAELSARWCECNPNNGFKAVDVVHTICYALILLNTDLHLADIDNKMTKSAYVKNTLQTVKRVVADAAPGAFDEATVKLNPGSSRGGIPWSNPTSSTPSSPSMPPDTPIDRTSFDEKRTVAAKRLSIRPGVFRHESDGCTPDSAGGSSTAANALVNQSWEGNMRGWEFEIEAVLKAFYSSIRSDPLPLHGFNVSDGGASGNLSVGNLGLKRSGSVVSKSPSDTMSHRSKGDFRGMTMRWPGRNNRSKPKFYASSTVTSSRTSFDDNNSIWSPAQSSTWGSKYSLGKTLTSTSLGSLGQHFGSSGSDYKHSIGFANALSQAIIREESANSGLGDSESSVSVPKGVLEDEALALEGAPWAKEGLVKHKHHKNDAGAKAKDRNWDDCFAVISKGKLTLFAFNTSTKSRSMGRNSNAASKAAGRAASVTTARVGGGDWMENAEKLDDFVLRQTIASVLPPPGYSKNRPHVWALHLPSGAIHLFHVGTPEIAKEFMTTANYWSARLSKEPLQGGVSNIEYGWSDLVINTAILEHQHNAESVVSSPPPSIANRQYGHTHTPSSSTLPRPSTQSSLRASFDTGFGDRHRARLPGDKAQLAEWQPPTQSMMASQLMEIDQLRSLQAYVAHVETELEKHNELKHGIELAYSPRHPNFAKSMVNWQRKSEYLLRENVKFRTYIDSLMVAQQAKDRVYAVRNAPATAGGSSYAESPRNGSIASSARQQVQSPLSQQQRPATTTVPSSGTADDSAWKERRDTTPRASKVPAGINTE
ncbi:hypothetical protein K431DRAFT_160444 [Polychaeton citri CBS 116435]|uniref:SEC7 domain-containing protein n=1 Tax=Polychaeton citri CBS 116435 TaxID=1314669 RepID=A0A9P4ULS6_9PEZI|nr:hypothetical protein K431DRAFT_160444 [Polychaeton citri CBS 116435]